MWRPTVSSDELYHSAKGTTWKKHKYIAIKNGQYIYDRVKNAANKAGDKIQDAIWDAEDAAYKAKKATKKAIGLDKREEYHSAASAEWRQQGNVQGASNKYRNATHAYERAKKYLSSKSAKEFGESKVNKARILDEELKTLNKRKNETASAKSAYRKTAAGKVELGSKEAVEKAKKKLMKASESIKKAARRKKNKKGISKSTVLKVKSKNNQTRRNAKEGLVRSTVGEKAYQELVKRNRRG